MMKSISINLDGEQEEKEISEWEVKEAINTLMSADAILKNPDMMKLVKEKQKSLAKVTSIQGLRDLANNPEKEEDDEDEAEGETMDEDMTPDDKAVDEPMDKRIKNSANPTIVGKQYK